MLVRVDEHALHVRRGLHLRRVPWVDTAVLRGGPHLLLPGVPREDAERLAAALTPLRPDVPAPAVRAPRRVMTPSTPSPVPDQDLDREGPFRRGPGR